MEFSSASGTRRRRDQMNVKERAGRESVCPHWLILAEPQSGPRQASGRRAFGCRGPRPPGGRAEEARLHVWAKPSELNTIGSGSGSWIKRERACVCTIAFLYSLDRALPDHHFTHSLTHFISFHFSLNPPLPNRDLAAKAAAALITLAANQIDIHTNAVLPTITQYTIT